MKRTPVPAGVLCLHKPSGPTSRDMVNRVMRILGTRRVGHAGTLDPFAEGLLLVAWGKDTGLVPYLQDHLKTYEARVRFGVSTDTQDRTGTVLETRSAAHLTPETIRGSLGSFRGIIRQTPPMYSALKQEGERLYRLAREGKEVARAPRECRVDAFDLLEWDAPVGVFRITCSRGTYVRTLAHDLGRALETGASLDRLLRTRVGPHDLEHAVDVRHLNDLDRDGLLALALRPAEALPDWPTCTVNGEEAEAVGRGSWRDPRGRLTDAGSYRILDEAGNLLALARGGSGTPVKLLRVLAEGGPP